MNGYKAGRTERTGNEASGQHASLFISTCAHRIDGNDVYGTLDRQGRITTDHSLLAVIQPSSWKRVEWKRNGVRELRQQEQLSHQKLIQVINRLRHDWMNDTQILFGYIQLKKFDNLQPYMEKIKMTMQQESNLSKLGIPSLIAFLLLFRVQSKSLELEVELDQEINLGQLPLHDGLDRKIGTSNRGMRSRACCGK